MGARRGRRTAFGLVVAMGAMNAAAAGTTATTTTTAAEFDAEARVRVLEARVAELEASLDLSGGSAGAARTLDAVLRDAERRSALLAVGGSGASAGYDDGFFIRSGAFLLKPSVFLIFRNTTSYVGGDETSWENGFSLRRVELGFEGTAFSPRLGYHVVWKATQDGVPRVDEGYVTYALTEDGRWSLKAGQFKDHVFQEEWVSSKRQLAAERSMLNNVLMGGCTERVQGVALRFGNDADAVRADVALHDGAGSHNTPFTDSPAVGSADEDFGVSARVDWKLAGRWKDQRDFSARDAQEDLLVLGAGVDWTQGTFIDAAGAGQGGDRIYAALDAQWELAGPKLGLFGALVADYTRFRDGSSAAGDGERLNWGALAQAGWALSRRWEVFGRYDVVVLDDDFRPAGADDVFSEITAGVNFYLGAGGSAGHRGKLTADVGYLPDGAPAAMRSIGVPVAGEDDAVCLRVQLLLVI